MLGLPARAHHSFGAEYDVNQPVTNVPDDTPNHPMTPESYLGYQRLDRFAGGAIQPDRYALYRFPARLDYDQLAYSGSWRVGSERITAGPFARLRLNFAAQKIHLVLGGKGTVDVLVDGKRIGRTRVTGEPRLYTLASFPREQSGLLELRFTPKISAYAFTFG